MESSDNLASTHKTFTNHRQYYSVVDISFLWDGGGGNILWYNILTPPPPLQKILKNSILQTESSDNLASRHKTFMYYRHDYSVVYISFLWDGGGGGQNIMV